MRGWRLRLLYRVRAWIDSQVPRDVLIIEIRDNEGKLLYWTDHMTALLAVTMTGPVDGVIDLTGMSRIRMTFRKEHLSQ